VVGWACFNKKSFGQFDSQPFPLNDQKNCIILLSFYYFENKIGQKGRLAKKNKNLGE
jgi:hypothetical protein